MKVLCIGIYVADVLAKPIDKLPERGKLELINNVELHTGGCPSNTGIGLARLGIKTGAMGKIGQDGFGDFILNKLRSEKIDIKGMKRDKKANTSFTFVMIHSDAERSFFHYMGANAIFSEKDIDYSVVRKYDIVHVAGTNLMPGFDGLPTARFFKKAKKMGKITSMDTAWNSTIDWYKVSGPSLPYLDFFVPSIEEARMIAGKEAPEDVADFLMKKGVKVVGLKMGSKGSYVATKEGRWHFPVFKTKCVDSTGAGDAFAAGFLAGVARGWEMKECARLGNAVGACCVQAIGCTDGVRSWEETMKFMKSTPTV